MKVVHYLNQFFAGIGGEEAADHPPEYREGPLGAGRSPGRVVWWLSPSSWDSSSRRQLL
ncbi:hypothetical protein CM1200mP19_2600 [bacterium]|nr:MAG: hypothetical protein CM1200mP19_2600 [bacterium]